MKEKYDGLIDNMCEEELVALALKGFFVRDVVNDRVFCPRGFVLHKKSIKKNGCTRYCSKHACSMCDARCFVPNEKKKWKEIDFPPSCRIKGKKIDTVLTGLPH